MNVKIWSVTIEDMTRKIADNKHPHPIIATSYVEERTRADAMDSVVWREVEAIRKAVGEPSDAIAAKRIRITAKVSHSVTAIGHDGLTRKERDAIREERKAARKAAKANKGKAARKAAKERKAAEAAASEATMTAKDGRPVFIPDGAKAAKRAKAKAVKVA